MKGFSIFGVREFIPAFFAFIARIVGWFERMTSKNKDKESGNKFPHSKSLRSECNQPFASVGYFGMFGVLVDHLLITVFRLSHIA